MSNSTQNNYKNIPEEEKKYQDKGIANQAKKTSTQNNWAKKAEDWFVDKVDYDKSDHSYKAKFNSLLALIEEIRADARKEVIDQIDRDIKTMLDPYEYRGKITAQEAKEQTVMLVRSILNSLKKEQIQSPSHSKGGEIICNIL